MEDMLTPQFTFYGTKAPNTRQNRMLIKLFDPSENALPLIYDNFDWSHCAEMVSSFDSQRVDMVSFSICRPVPASEACTGDVLASSVCPEPRSCTLNPT